MCNTFVVQIKYYKNDKRFSKWSGTLYCNNCINSCPLDITFVLNPVKMSILLKGYQCLLFTYMMSVNMRSRKPHCYLIFLLFQVVVLVVFVGMVITAPQGPNYPYRPQVTNFGVGSYSPVQDPVAPQRAYRPPGIQHDRFRSSSSTAEPPVEPTLQQLKPNLSPKPYVVILKQSQEDNFDGSFSYRQHSRTISFGNIEILNIYNVLNLMLRIPWPYFRLADVNFRVKVTDS